MTRKERGRAAGSWALLGAALIWGLAFVAQRYGAGLLDAISLNALRYIMGAVVLPPIFLISDAIRKRRGLTTLPFNRDTVIGGILCGAILFVATTAQQFGLESTSAGKAGFITALYIVFVPLLGIMAQKKTKMTGWLAAIIAISGFWTMSVGKDFSVTGGDVLVLLCAVCFSFQILFIDVYADNCDPIKFTFVQFATAAAIGVPCMAANGFPEWSAILKCGVPLLYMGILSSGVAYTLQVAGQQRAEPALATLIMSLESVFALVGGALILGESFTMAETAGCALVFAGVFLAQLEFPRLFLKFYPDSRKLNFPKRY